MGCRTENPIQVGDMAEISERYQRAFRVQEVLVLERDSQGALGRYWAVWPGTYEDYRASAVDVEYLDDNVFVINEDEMTFLRRGI